LRIVPPPGRSDLERLGTRLHQDVTGEAAALPARPTDAAVPVAQPPPLGQLVGGLLAPLLAQLAAIRPPVAAARAGASHPFGGGPSPSP
jgi:hypothetical protein